MERHEVTDGNTEDVRSTADSTPETVVEDLWREGWFRATAKAMCRGVAILDADDMASEAAIVAQRSADSWTGEGAVRAWVKWRARNYMITMRDRASAKTAKHLSSLSIYDVVPGTSDYVMDKVADPAPGADLEAELVAWDEAAFSIRSAIEALTPNQRQYVMLRFFQDGHKFEEGHVSYKHLTGAWPGARQKLKVMLSDLKWMIRE